MTFLSIGQFSALDVGVEAFIDIAAANSCQAVSLLVRSPSSQAQLPLVSGQNLPGVKHRLQATGVTVLNVDCFMLAPGCDVPGFRDALEIGRQLGAKGATALLYDADDQRLRHHLLQLCGMARELGLKVNIEFMPFTPLYRTLQQATDLVLQLQQPNLGLTIDLLHLVRSGGSVTELAQIPAELIHCVQICDSRDGSAHGDYAEEAAANRLAPGEGVFPIAAFLRALPDHTPVEIEVPQPPGEPAAERIQAIISGTLQQFALAGMR